MKYIVIGFVVWFTGAWFPQFVKGWINVIRFKIKRKKAESCEKWIYEMWDKGARKNGV